MILKHRSKRQTTPITTGTAWMTVLWMSLLTKMNNQQSPNSLQTQLPKRVELVTSDGLKGCSLAKQITSPTSQISKQVRNLYQPLQTPRIP